MIIFYLIINLYLIFSFKIIKKKKFLNVFEKISNKSIFVICFYICVLLKFYIYILLNYNFLYIFFFYSSVDILTFFFRCLIIEIYYNFYFKIETEVDNIQYYLYRYALSPFLEKQIFLFVSFIYFIMTFYYFNIIIYIIVILYYSFYSFLYLFDRSFDDAFFRFNCGYKIYLKESGLKKLIKYQNFLLYSSKREEKDCRLIWGKDFFFKNSNNNKRYKSGNL